MVMPMVKVPHELSASALTTARPRPASAMTTMKRMAMAPVVPATGPISVRAMSASERPPRRTEAHSEMKSWTAPARQTPPTIHSRPGRVAELRREHRADQRAGAGDGREMVAEEHPPASSDSSCARRTSCAPASRASRRATSPSRRDERAVIAIRDRQNAQRRHDNVEGIHRRNCILERCPRIGGCWAMRSAIGAIS